MQPIFGTRLLLGPPRFPFSINSHFPFETFLIYRRESRQKECLRVGIWSVGRLWAENWEPLKLGFDWTSFKLGFYSATLKLGFDWASFKLGFDWASSKIGLNFAPLKLGFYWRASNNLIEKKTIYNIDRKSFLKPGFVNKQLLRRLELQIFLGQSDHLFPFIALNILLCCLTIYSLQSDEWKIWKFYSTQSDSWERVFISELWTYVMFPFKGICRWHLISCRLTFSVEKGLLWGKNRFQFTADAP